MFKHPKQQREREREMRHINPVFLTTVLKSLYFKNNYAQVSHVFYVNVWSWDINDNFYYDHTYTELALLYI